MSLFSDLLGISPHQTTIEGMLNDIAADVFSGKPTPTTPATSTRGAARMSWEGQHPSWSSGENRYTYLDPVIIDPTDL